MHDPVNSKRSETITALTEVTVNLLDGVNTANCGYRKGSSGCTVFGILFQFFLLISHTKRGCIVDTVGTVNPVTESSESKCRHNTSVSKFSLLYIVEPSL